MGNARFSYYLSFEGVDFEEDGEITSLSFANAPLAFPYIKVFVERLLI